MIALDFGRAIRSELAKLSWRSSVWYAAIPLAVLVPVVINFGIAVASESDVINTSGNVETSNAGYWITLFTPLILMAPAVSSVCSEFKDSTIEIVFSIQPRRWLSFCAKFVVFGVIAAVTTAVTVFILFWGFPHVFTQTWGSVNLFSSEGMRLFITIPICAMGLVALGIGLSALIPRPGFVVMLVLLWDFGIETAFNSINNDFGYLLQKLAPFKNSLFGVGQSPSPIEERLFGGMNGSLLYFLAFCFFFFAVGMVKTSSSDVKA